eukprot:TRINITY_DN5239_c0_g1_i1.p2 TRINITY_DN5239_c0_g1~~TRINITY_DN5239_c0_g1_i1.p2  ORF type:complete len:101 (+),score=21.63 TRINITY_DN5239_c0_g1_i1:33-335(+)
MAKSIRCLDCNEIFDGVDDEPSGMCTCPPPASFDGPIFPGGFRQAPWEWIDPSERGNTTTTTPATSRASDDSAASKESTSKGSVTGSPYFDSMLKIASCT